MAKSNLHPILKVKFAAHSALAAQAQSALLTHPSDIIVTDILKRFYGFDVLHGQLVMPSTTPENRAVVGHRGSLPLCVPRPSDVRECLESFCGNYLNDDACASLDENGLSPGARGDLNYESNITQTGAAMWLIEQITGALRCCLLSYDATEVKLLGEFPTFEQAAQAREAEVTRRQWDPKNTRMDFYCQAGTADSLIVLPPEPARAMLAIKGWANKGKGLIEN